MGSRGQISGHKHNHTNTKSIVSLLVPIALARAKARAHWCMLPAVDVTDDKAASLAIEVAERGMTRTCELCVHHMYRM